MWGNIFLETMFSGNYTFGFLTLNNANLLHLSQWQYWFWFFFTWFFGLYYIIFINFLFKRSYSQNPKIATSFRSHGKWGDYIVCFIPISWCLNILTNSNYILRLVEWQSESYSYSLRVRGKQWYWVYKLTNTNTFFQKNINFSTGVDNWVSFSDNTSKLKLFILTNQVVSIDQSVYHDYFSFYKKNSGWMADHNDLTINHVVNELSPSNDGFGLDHPNNFFADFCEIGNIDAPETFSFYDFRDVTMDTPFPVTNYTNKSPAVSFEEFEFKSTIAASSNSPIYENLNFSTVDSVRDKTKRILDPIYVILKQKRFHYKSHIIEAERSLGVTANDDLSLFQQFSKNSFFSNYVHSKRLLRTFRLLVLPTNINICVITNSFDVIHSWFIPGLGLKLDCVPGRSTHHTLHILNPGFYYGQCAEICGRYHHHMPIRLVALQYPHFIFWWHNKGVKQLLNLRYSKNNNIVN